MAKRTCSVEGCEQPHKGRGFCNMHLRRVRAHGDPGQADRLYKPRDTRCEIDGCGKPHRAVGLCRMHYTRLQRHGDPLATKTPLRGLPPAAVIANRIAITPMGCWQWTGYIAEHGYGIFHSHGEALYAHRVSYETFVGPIPTGLVLDHL